MGLLTTPDRRARFPGRSVRVAVLLLAILVGGLLAPHYGQGWDESGDASYGRDSLRAYLGSPAFLNHGDRIYYGPFFLMLAEAVVWLGRQAAPSVHPVDIRHFLGFLAFAVGVLVFYDLCRRLMSRAAAVVASLLLATQPILFGHAFVNGKDIPFLGMFLIAIAVGLRAADEWSARGAMGDLPKRAERLLAASPKGRPVAVLLAAGSLAAAGVLWSSSLALPPLESTLRHAYQGAAWEPVNAAFRAVAQDAYKTPVEAYLAKARLAYLWMRIPLGLAILALGTMGGARVLGFQPALAALVRDRALKAVILAGVVLGLATSVRVAGLFVIVLVGLYWLQLTGLRSVRPFVIYLAAAAVVTYLTWPWLWENPLPRLRESLMVMGAFRPVLVVFDGQSFLSTELPRDYLPRLLSLQLTEPALVLSILGSILGVVRMRMRAYDRSLAILLFVWFAVPLLAVVAWGTPIYNNGRQLLFALPPLFVWSGMALEDIGRRLRGRVWVGIGWLLVLAPGVIGIVRLHPYEYTYYNGIIGGAEGAAGRYELDYWCTSYREAMTFLNGVAPAASTVVAIGPDSSARSFARPDLEVRGDWQPVEDPDFALVCIRSPGAHQRFAESPIIYRVQRAGAVFALVRDLAR